jgi:hypothetical protein
MRQLFLVTGFAAAAAFADTPGRCVGRPLVAEPQFQEYTMRIQAALLLAAFAFSLPAQTDAQPAKKDGATEKLWKIETNGISG